MRVTTLSQHGTHEQTIMGLGRSTNTIGETAECLIAASGIGSLLLPVQPKWPTTCGKREDGSFGHAIPSNIIYTNLISSLIRKEYRERLF